MLVVGGPALVGDPDTAEVDDRIDAVEDRAVEVARVRVPQALVRAVRVGTDQPGDLVAGAGEGGGQLRCRGTR